MKRHMCWRIDHSECLHIRKCLKQACIKSPWERALHVDMDRNPPTHTSDQTLLLPFSLTTYGCVLALSFASTVTCHLDCPRPQLNLQLCNNSNSGFVHVYLAWQFTYGTYVGYVTLFGETS